MSKRKISVVMASFLGNYGEFAATNRTAKFKRAVKSFLNQTYTNKELIIVADGCKETQKIYDENWSNINEIKCVLIPKQNLYSGEPRNVGNNIASGDIITYLDNDDVIGNKHLEIIEKQFSDNYDWVYYNDYLVLDKNFKKLKVRRVQTRFGSIGTSSISHKPLNEKIWSVGYGHDWLVVLKLAAIGGRFKKLKDTPQYLVAHWGLGQKGIETQQGGDF